MKQNVRKGISMLLAVLMLLSVVPAAASNIDEVDNVKIVDHIVQGSARGTSFPMKKWDLTKSAYGGEFTDVAAGVYTNYYFTGVTQLVVTFRNLTTEDDLVMMEYTLTDMSDSTKTYATKSVRVEKGETKETGGWPYAGLDTSHHYCVFIRTVNSGTRVSGKVVVSKPM